MTPSAESLKHYVSETLHQPLTLHPWPKEEALPLLLQHSYDFFEGGLVNTQLVFLFAKEEPTPATVAKHLQMLKEYTQDPLVVVADRATSTWRSRMIEKGVPFVVPGNQLYLPMLAVDLREWFRPPAKKLHHLSPSAQVVFLWALLNNAADARTAAETSRQLGYSAMTVGRALDQLEEFDLVEVSRSGRERLFGIEGDRRAAWEKAQPMLSSPVKQQAWVRTEWARSASFHAVSAGLTALSALSMIVQPRLPVLAVTQAAFRDLLQEQSVERTEAEEYANAQLQVWSYSPRLLSPGEHVDQLSLYLSLRDDPDERVQSALDELMRGFAW
jgi:DNA-binding MarR family transcriptional regulator